MFFQNNNHIIAYKEAIIMIKILKYTFLSLILFIMLSSLARSQVTESAYKGTHFYVGFMQNEIDWSILIVGKLILQIQIVAEQKANIIVTMPYESTLHTIDADSILVINVRDGMEIEKSEEITRNLVEIESDVPIVVYCFNSRSQTTDSYAAIPVSRWGNEYVTVNYSNDQYNYTNESDKEFALVPRSSEFLIMAAYDSTIIEITPASVTRKNKQYGKQYYDTLNTGEAYLVQSFPAEKGYGDLTGSIIKSSKPVGVLSGHVRASVPNNINIDSKDHLCEMLMPKESWGKKFISVPFGVNTVGDLFRIVCGYENTIVSYRSASKEGTTELDKPGDFKEFINAFQPIVWQSNRPVQIAQYMKRFGGINDPENYDPCMVILPPVEQFVNRILFQVPDYDIAAYGQFQNHIVSIVATEDALETIKVNNTLVMKLDNIYNNTIPGEKINWARFELTPGKYVISCEKGGFTGILFGRGDRDSYAHVLGSSLVNLNAKDSIAPEIFVTENCGKISGYIREYINLGNTGIDFADIVKSLTYNYIWTISPITDTTTFVYFSAEPENQFEDGGFALDYRDRAGNGDRYHYKYNGIKLDFRENGEQLDLQSGIIFSDINTTDSVCKTINVTNYGKGEVFITRFRFTGGTNVSYVCDASFPKHLAPGESFDFTVCFMPHGDTSALKAKIDVNIFCLDDFIIPITGSVKLPEITIADYDFGKVLVGQDSCAEISIINTGTQPIKIDSLKIPGKIRFFYKDNIVFPLVLEAGEKIVLRFCFNPDSVGNFNARISTYNDYKLDSYGKLEGVGGYQEINNILIDWKKRRIGTINDTTAVFTNTGDLPCLLSLNNFIKNSIEISSDSISKFLNTPIPAGSSYPFVLSFHPSAVRKYELIAVMNTDWALHPEIRITLLGEGTLPEINVFDIVIDTTVIYNRRDSICTIISSAGNEQLAIDTIRFFSGDSSSFNIDYPVLTDIVLPEGNFLEIPIMFIPQKLGWNEIILEVISDAMPNYQRKKTYFSIKGYAIPEDTLNSTINLEIPLMNACVAKTVYPEIKNTGNINLELRTSPNISTNGGLSAQLMNEPNYPLMLAPDSSLFYELRLLPYGDGEKSIRIKQMAYGKSKVNDEIIDDSLELNVLGHFTPEMHKLIINHIEDFKSIPGDTITITLSGKFPNGIDTIDGFKFETGIKINSFYYIKEKNYLNVHFGENKLTYPLEIRQESNNLILSCNEKITFMFGTNWDLSFKLLTLLDESYEGAFWTKISSEMCFLPDSIEAKYEINGVCVRNLRMVDVITDKAWLYIAPNLAREQINVRLFLPDNGRIELSVFDITGKKYQLLSNKYLAKGDYSLIFDISDLQTGMYFIRMKTDKSIESQKLFILK